MRTMLGRTLVAGYCLLLVGLLTFAAPGANAAQVSTPEAGEDAVYRDPAGRFSVPIPTNWLVEEHDGYVSLVTSDGKIDVSIVIVDGASASAAIGEAMQRIGSDSSATPVPPPIATPSTEADDVALFTYDDGADSGRFIQGVGQRVENVVFVLVLQGDLDAVNLRQVQIDKIFYGIQVDLSVLGTPAATPAA